MARIDADTLLKAYSIGVFPMAASRDDPRLYWFDPDMRGIIPLDGFHVPKRLARTVRSGRFEIRVNSAFDEVMAACAEPRPDSAETWINAEIRSSTASSTRAAMRIASNAGARDGSRAGSTASASARRSSARACSGRETDASKVALVHLVERLRREASSCWTRSS